MTTAITAAGSSYGDTEAEQPIQTTVQPAVALNKVSSIENGTVDPETGIIDRALKSVFSIKTNGNCDFIITSRIATESGDVSAYGQDGKSILFGHTLALPTQSAIENAKIGGNNNKNVIAYPVSGIVTAPEFLEVKYQNNYGNYGDGYVFAVISAMDGTVTHSVSPNPISGTYSISQDRAGTYKTTVYITAVSKN